MMPTDSLISWDNEFALSLLPDLFQGLWLTIQITLIGTAIALVLGLFVAIVRFSRIPVVSQLFGFYVQFVRGTPLLVQAYLAFFALPSFGIKFPALVTGIAVIGINYSAYTAEVYRAGVNDVPAGQWEAATALSMPRARTWFRVVLPQAIRSVVPMLGNYLVQMFKDSAILFAITIYELMGHVDAITSSTYRYLEPLTIAALMYLTVSMAASLLIRLLERRLVISR
ncbi:MAG TPA: ectoine/hydroxyectoine ABC transporter permease subunit EhuD [Segeticoccus sp.]|jgi:polar amino acid transport system permease protein|nr:ectoine/hydroxyectoine ABC transporter permease subunit EhuD [Segeticoccus sp.]